MNDNEFLAGRFEEHRSHLKAVAYRMLGSLAEADDAVQEAWLRLARTDSGEIENLGGWLTTVVGRVCLDMLRTRTARREDPLTERLPDPIVVSDDRAGPEHQALMADSVGLALLVVLESLNPAERLAFVLHDMFAMTFEEIAPIVDRSAAATRQLASRARRRVQGAKPAPDADPADQRRVVDAFLAAARDGDFDALVAILDPDVVERVDTGVAPVRPIRGAAKVAAQAIAFQRLATGQVVQPALVNGAAGLVDMTGGRPQAVVSFTVTEGKIIAIDILTDPDRIAGLDLTDFTRRR